MTDQATDDGMSRPRKGRKAGRGAGDFPIDGGVAVNDAATITPGPFEPASAPASVLAADSVMTAPEPEAAVQMSAENASTETAEPGPATTKSTAETDKTSKYKEIMTMDKAIKTAEDLMAFSQGNVEALIKSSQIWTAGVQDLTKHIAATAQAQMDETMANVKALTSVKSIKEALDLQTSLAKAAMEKALAETGKISDATVKLTEETLAPITARVTLATETFSRTA
jgi:phasin family protein